MPHDRRAFLRTTLAASAALAADRRAGAQPWSPFPGFSTQKIQTSGATIHTLRGGSGPPLLLIHGYPHTHVEWHEIAHRLARAIHGRDDRPARLRRQQSSPGRREPRGLLEARDGAGPH